METKLFYNLPTSDWMEGLPISNGRLAAMIISDKKRDIFSLNHEWLWRGKNRFRDNENVADKLQEVRKLIKKKDYFRSTCIANTYFAGLAGMTGIPGRVDPYQPAGDLTFEIDGCKEFLSRKLDISSGTASSERAADGAVKGTYFADYVTGNIVCRWEGSFGGTLSYARCEDKNCSEKLKVSENEIVYGCEFDSGIEFTVRIRVFTDGVSRAQGGKLHIKDATVLTAYINIATSVKDKEEELKKYDVAEEPDFKKLLICHEKKFGELFGRCEIELDGRETDITTDERIRLFKEGREDALLPLLYFNYGKYLLISTSVGGDLPANLQGKWNANPNPPWECDYHFDINIQMNYWASEQLGLPECTESMLNYLKSFEKHGEKAAMDLYGCRGIYLPLQTDAWGRSTPEAYGWAVWIGAAAWLSQHFMRHYEYGGDTEFLRNCAYPFIRKTALFYEDYLEADENGEYQIIPSQSPENRFTATGMFPVSMAKSSAMDVQLAYDLLGYAIKSAEILGVDEEERKKWKHIRKHLPEFKIGADGRLLEWDEEKEEMEPGHRHFSHLYGMYPSDIFNPEERKAQYDAAYKSLEFRLAQGGGHTGWSRAWTACLYARAGKGEKVIEHIYAMIAEFATLSLLDLHPPHVFQIDGNLGVCAAVIETLAQFWNGRLHLLRALPKAWGKGKIRGLKVPGGHTVDFSWDSGEVAELKVRIGYAKRLVIADNFGNETAVCGECGEIKNICLKKGEEI